MPFTRFSFCFTALACFAAVMCSLQGAQAQNKLTLSDLGDFKNAGANWHIAGTVKADLTQKNTLNYSTGVGVLVNLPTDAAQDDLFTNLQHGDLDIELDYMMAKGSNSGIYLQGRYEVQLLDSWGVLNPHSGDNGGIYERWDDAKPEGKKGYDGHAPRQNVSRAPGLWQHLKISFQAPKFEGGVKITNAKMIGVTLNGVLIQENVELSGPTRGAVANDEVAEAALRLQGDHGPVAFRNIVLSNYNKGRPSLTGIHYAVYKGKYVVEPNYNTLKPMMQKAAPIISSAISGLPDNEYILRYTGMLHVQEPGEYNFSINTFGGGGTLKINNATVIPFSNWRGKGTANLAAGDIPFELSYSKYIDWAKPAVGVSIKGPGVREFLVSDANISTGDDADPVLVDAPDNIILRSFMDLPEGGRVVHAVNVGSPEKIHYTYDMDNGMIVQLWRGNFLDATPMWHERGDGSSRPTGAIQYFGKPGLNIAKLTDANARWVTDTSNAGYRAKGYELDEKGRPAFKYLLYGTSVSDATTVTENGQGIHRQISLQDATDNIYMRLATANSIEDMGNGWYLINDQSYYLKLDDAAAAKPLIRGQDGSKELIVPVHKSIGYSILF
ncbi:MAG: hypothetical protein JWR61_4833 [Ferruginibacter sp.]|uniref:family 16 glycoside hydrolase n=1 Tax=Ferruginibacter sp. TaxID=1940288 RepID=UPI002658CF2D|nr:family 16 glycoside hydrolase [Ferruginibacter sp.]MDB5279878.1 hypothetical protein [Ferruginibacter sp.]